MVGNFYQYEKREATEIENPVDWPDTEENQSSDEFLPTHKTTRAVRITMTMFGERMVEVVEEKRSNLVFIIIILLTRCNWSARLSVSQLNLKKDLEQSTKRLRDESAQFNAEQYKLKRLLSERERELDPLWKTNK